jgi:hypothetical protein
MNKKTITGQFHVVRQVPGKHGSCWEGRSCSAAQRRQMDGRILHAVGEAQDLIKRLLRQRAGSLEQGRESNDEFLTQLMWAAGMAGVVWARP